MTERRRRGEARAAIEDSARRLFAERGYRGTSLREIAVAADVNEALIFRHFGSKQALFEQTVVEPFHAFVDELIRRWTEREEPLANAPLVDLFVTDMYDFTLQHRDVLFSLVAAERFDGVDIGTRIYDEITRVAAASAAEAEARELTHTNFDIAVPCVVAMILGIVMFDGWLFAPGHRHPPTDEIRRAMIHHAIGGLRPVN
ncbi:TetR/AcrR family transcriptional regulator [Mycobacterium sp.]|uniref:TetR/AcrR family transcriptional regulator n=1 Tax=Mycobacterium sp. TaxID=1785 RepID=UPI00120100A5|nr:TetR/AcrR family transcriptional regulator [Mycobacterium sp.]TAM72042.1 MAG: TetR/AcrR family transcriptional regulator [Mycobacterium sp.]